MPREAAELRRCGICSKPLLRRQKAGCCMKHGNMMQWQEIWAGLPAERCCTVCGGPMAKRKNESWVQFAARPSCSRLCGARWSAGKRAIAISARARAKRPTSRPDLAAENWS